MGLPPKGTKAPQKREAQFDFQTKRAPEWALPVSAIKNTGTVPTQAFHVTARFHKGWVTIEGSGLLPTQGAAFSKVKAFKVQWEDPQITCAAIVEQLSRALNYWLLFLPEE